MAHRHGRRRPGAASHHGPTRSRSQAIEGTLRVARPGSASVETAEGAFVVARGGVREGMNGDVVRVTLQHRRGAEPLARVQSVVSRATETFAGTFEEAGPLGVIVPLDERIRHDFFVLPADASAERLGVSPGDVVGARILTYPSRSEAGVVTIERRVGSGDALDLDVEGVIASFGLRRAFPDAARRQAESVEARVDEALAEDPVREDLRDVARATSTTPSRARGCRTAASSWACTSPT